MGEINGEGVSGSYKLNSFKRMSSEDNVTFRGLLVSIIVLVGLHQIVNLISLCRKRPVPKLNDPILMRVFDIALRTALVVYCILRLVTTSAYDETFLNDTFSEVIKVPWIDGKQTFVHKFELFFVAVGEITDAFSTEYRFLTFAYILVYAMFIRFILYMAAHPRIAILVNTVREAMDELFHFAITFIMLFLVLAFLGYWVIGPDNPDYGEFSASLYRHMKMLLGDYDWPDKQADVFFMIHHITFVIVVFFILLNFFLAIIVDAFGTVKSGVEDCVVEQNIVLDVYDIFFRKAIMAYRYGWPDTEQVLLEVDRDIQDNWFTVNELAGLQCFNSTHAHVADMFFKYYRNHFDSMHKEDEEEEEKDDKADDSDVKSTHEIEDDKKEIAHTTLAEKFNNINDNTRTRANAHTSMQVLAVTGFEKDGTHTLTHARIGHKKRGVVYTCGACACWGEVCVCTRKVRGDETM
eukprot:GDKI01033488.1.p1 GENE.GDKI01033488.1~~GDKI01033488.1.p1  ORF type:complete len:464 (+),score=113.31 GDKI01033488.1:1-1392(+)